MLFQIPSLPGNWGLVDLETPSDAHRMPAWTPGVSSELQLIFSDEFNTDGRTFYPGDDPYWEAVDLHYWVRFPLNPCHRVNTDIDLI